MRIEPQISAVQVVLVGAFNPTIFQPFWFFHNGLVSEQAAINAQVTVVHPEICQFAMESLFLLSATTDKLTIERTTAPLIFAADLVYRMFTELLPHTPVDKMGINRVVHFTVPPAARDRIGLQLAPRAPWGKWGEAVSSGTGLKHGGLQSLTLIQRNVSDRPQGSIQAKIEPSSRVGDGQSGIYMEINDHYELTASSNRKDVGEMMAILHDKFDSSIQNSESIIDQIMGLAQ